MSIRHNHVKVGAQSNDHSAQLAGIPPRQFFTDAEIFVRTQLLVSEYYRVDTPINFWDVYNVEAEALGQQVIYPSKGLPDVDRSHLLINDPSDLDKLVPPDPYTSGRLPWVQQVCKHFLEMTGELERVYFTAPFSLAVNIRGYENLVDDMYTRPRFVRQHGIAVAAGIDAVLLKEGPPGAIADRIRHYIDILARMGYCMIHLNQIPADTPSQHIHTAVEACRTFGRLPLVGNLKEVSFEPPHRESFSEFLNEKGA